MEGDRESVARKVKMVIGSDHARRYEGEETA